MNTLFIVFWSVMIFASIAWYFFLIFYVGFKGGREIGIMTRGLTQKAKDRDEKLARGE